jgi:hypothetical protein
MNKYDKRKKEKIYITKNLCVLLSLVLRLHVCPDLEKKNGEDKQNQSQILYPHRAEQWLCGTPFSTHTHTQLIFIHIYIPILTFLHGDKRERQVLSVLPSLSFFFAWLHKLLSGDGFRQVTDPSFSFFLISFELIFFLPWAPLA